MSQSSNSPGPQRSQRSPYRPSPYHQDQRRHRDHRSNDENYGTAVGPGQPGNFASQYQAYNSGFSMGYDATPGPLSSLQNHDILRRMPALTTVNLDELSTEYGLDTTQRKAMHHFGKLSDNDRLTMIFVRLQHTENQSNELQRQIAGLQSKLESVGAFCAESWKPSGEQIKLLKSLLRHYIIRPITSYSNLVPIVKTYILDHARSLRLELYKTDPTVKTAIHDLLGVENGSVRSALRKLVFASVKGKIPLMKFSKKTIDAYHLPTIPDTPPQGIMACLAFFRKVAHPLAHKTYARGGDSGFWRDVEKGLDVLFEKNGNDRSSREWLEWEKQIIDEDNCRYNRSGAETSARSQEDIDVATRPRGAGNESDEEDEVPEDRDISVDGLGDLAATTAGPVSR